MALNVRGAIIHDKFNVVTSGRWRRREFMAGWTRTGSIRGLSWITRVSILHWLRLIREIIISGVQVCPHSPELHVTRSSLRDGRTRWPKNPSQSISYTVVMSSDLRFLWMISERRKSGFLWMVIWRWTIETDCSSMFHISGVDWDMQSDINCVKGREIAGAGMGCISLKSMETRRRLGATLKSDVLYRAGSSATRKPPIQKSRVSNEGKDPGGRHITFWKSS